MEVAARGFAELPQDILMNIFSLLETPDLVRVGAVCCSWNLSYARICRSGLYKWHQTPCLIYTSEPAGDNTPSRLTLQPRGKKGIQINSARPTHPQKVPDWIVTWVVDYG